MSENKHTKPVAVITGAGSGIGAATANLLAKKGWKVILNGRSLAKLEYIAKHIYDGGGEVVAIAGDVTKTEDVRRLIAAAGSRIDALIHSAGIGHCLTIDELDEQEWQDTLNVAATGAFLTAKHALPVMRQSRGGSGHIIQIASLASGGTWELEIGYGTAKGAQVKFALHLAEHMQKEHAAGGKKIHVHAVCPGTVNTPFWDRIPQRNADPDLTLSPEQVAWMVGELIDNPDHNAESLAAIKPHKDIVIERHAPFERWDNVVAMKHVSHP